jgi:hypothetical protein
MEFVNLFKSAHESLQDEARRRRRYCLGVMMAWAVLMLILLVSLHLMKKNQQTKWHAVNTAVEQMQRQVEAGLKAKKLWEAHQQALCTAAMLETLFNQPIKAVHLNAIDYAGRWTIEGVADYPEAVNVYKQWLNRHFVQSDWKEQFTEAGAFFRVEGEGAC